MSATDNNVGSIPQLYQEFDRKVTLSKISCAAERLTPAFVPPLYSIMAATTATFMGGWEHVPETIRPYVWAGIAGASIVPIPFMMKRPLWISSDEAAHRLDEDLGDTNKPAYNLLHRNEPENADDATKAFWHISQERKLRTKLPEMKVRSPGLDIHSSLKILGLTLMMATGAATFDAGDDRSRLLSEAFNFTPPPEAPKPIEFRAWTEPPKGIEGAEYRYLPGSGVISEASSMTEIPPVHQQSILNIFVIGQTPNVTVNGQPIAVEKEITDTSNVITYVYTPYTLSDAGQPYIVSMENGPTWSIPLSIDQPPEVEITGMDSDDYDRTINIRCNAGDDYGITYGAIEFTIPGTHPDSDVPVQAELPPVPVDTKEFCK